MAPPAPRGTSLSIRCATLVYCDNVSVVYLSTNPVQYQRTKHIEIDLHFVRDKVTAEAVCVLHVPTTSKYEDIFTKCLPTSVFTELRSSLNVLQHDLASTIRLEDVLD
jgi:hypothetical protein